MKPLSDAERKQLIKLFPELDKYDDWEHYLEADVIVKLFARKLLAQTAEIERLRGKKDHPEHYCHRCGGRNMSWHTDNETWNLLVRDSGYPGIICPICLDELDREKNGDFSHWVIVKE